MISFGLTLRLPKVYEQDRSRREHPAGRSALPSASRNFRKVEMSIRDAQNSIKVWGKKDCEAMMHPDKVRWIFSEFCTSGTISSCVLRRNWVLLRLSLVPEKKPINFPVLMPWKCHPIRFMWGRHKLQESKVTDFSNRVRCTWYILIPTELKILKS